MELAALSSKGTCIGVKHGLTELSGAVLYKDSWVNFHCQTLLPKYNLYIPHSLSLCQPHTYNDFIKLDFPQNKNKS
jgi:hypothetical protein